MDLKDCNKKSELEDNIITNNGEVEKSTSLKKDKVSVLNSLVGIIPPLTDEDEMQLKEERINRRNEK